MCMRAYSVTQSCPTLCDPIVCSQPGSSVHGILQEHWSCLSFPPPGTIPDRGRELESPALAGRFFTTELSGKTLNVKV